MALYKVASGDMPLASDVDQLVDVFSGVHDIGAITFAPVVSAPSIAGVTATAVAGTALGIGTYRYALTYKTGYKKTNGTFVYTGETVASTEFTVTTTSANQNVNLAGLPTAWPSSVVAMTIWRTAVGGASGTTKLTVILTTPSATYADTVADASLGVVVPTTNTTGTTIGATTFSGVTTFGGNLKFTGGGHINAPAGSYVGFVNAADNAWQLKVQESNGAVTTANNTLDDGTTGDITLKRYINAGSASLRIIPQAAGLAGIVSSNGSVWALKVTDNGNTPSVTTANNMLDNGSGAATFAGPLTVNGAGSTLKGATHINDDGSSGTWIGWYQTGGARIGYVGGANSNATDVSMSADNGNIQLLVGTGKTVLWNGVGMAQTRTTNGYVEWNNAGTWQGVGGVKNVQRGSVSVANGVTTNVTITSVNMTKSFVTFNNLVQYSGSSAQQNVAAYLANATTLSIFNNTYAPFTFYWEVVESY